MRAILQHFNPPEKKWSLRSKTYSLKQEGRLLDEYASELNKYTTRLQMDPQTKLDLFIQGLDNSLKQHLLLKQPRTFDQALRAARLKDSVQQQDSNVDILLEKLVKRLQKQDLKASPASSPLASEIDKLKSKQESLQQLWLLLVLIIIMSLTQLMQPGRLGDLSWKFQTLSVMVLMTAIIISHISPLVQEQLTDKLYANFAPG